LAILLRFNTDLDPNTRFSDQDLLMRYHWGEGVGHLHAHQSTSLSISNKSSEQLMAIDTLDDPNTEELPGSKEDTHATDTDDDVGL